MISKINLRKRFSESKILVAPGAYDAFTAKLIESSGFESVYLSGAGVSYTLLGQPDTGQVTQTQMVEKVGTVANATGIPLIADGDTGYGNAVNVMETVRRYEHAGAAAIQLEDQQFPKRCGHLSGKELIPADEMVGKIRAAIYARASDEFLIIARTDALGVTGMQEAILRGTKYVDAGADMLFVESPRSSEELESIANEFSEIPLMANMVEGGKTPLLSADELESMGYSLVIYPNSLTRRFARAGLDLLADLRGNGTTRARLDKMMPFQELNAMLGIEDLKKLEQNYLPRPEKAA